MSNITCVISQPRLFPGLHYLDRMLLADVFVVLDSVQYNPRHEENRAKIKTSNGPQWLTVPMTRSGRDQLICDTHLSDQAWRDKALRTLHHAYGTAPRYDDTIEEVTKIISTDFATLSDLDEASWEPALRRLMTDDERAATRFVRATELDVDGRGGTLLVNLCQAVGADTYISGGFGRDYLDEDEFSDAGLALEFHDYDHPEYPQRHGEFVGFLSYLDALFNTELTPELVRNT